MADIIRPTGDIITTVGDPVITMPVNFTGHLRMPDGTLYSFKDGAMQDEQYKDRDNDALVDAAVVEYAREIEDRVIKSFGVPAKVFMGHQDGPEEVIDEAAYQFGWQAPKVIPDCTCKTLLNGHENGCPFAKQER